ncbi:alpha/beta hydrolase [Ruegeria denitrificans]|uniref:alpha/beta hydrolase n=1 Tax=Ruegeria denitrificans TaxID=1715692 RepID=UPI003C7B1301
MAGVVFFFLSRPIGNFVNHVASIECVEGEGKTIQFDVGDRKSEEARTFRNVKEIKELQESTLKELGDRVVIWVHGFRTDAVEADCAGRAMDIALSEQGVKSDVIVFAWPSEFELTEFSIAESMADAAGSHLAVLLNGLKDRQVSVVTHSLGARVALEAIRKAEFEEQEQLSLLYMIQPAVPATSVRRAILDFTCIPGESGEPIFYTNFPRTDDVSSCEVNGDTMQREFTGCYAEAILRVAAVKATFSDGDPVLGGPFALQHGPTDRCFGPTLPPVKGVVSTKLPQYLALGSRWREKHGVCVTHALKVGVEELRLNTDFDRDGRWHSQDVEIPTLAEAADDEMGPCVEFVRSSFHIEHPDFQFVELWQLRRFWRLANRHSPQNLPEARKAIAKAVHEYLTDQP